jgi:hypothetical protein
MKQKFIYILIRAIIYTLMVFFSTYYLRDVKSSTVSVFNFQIEVMFLAFIISVCFDFKFRFTPLKHLILMILSVISLHSILVALIVPSKELIFNAFIFNFSWHFLGFAWIWKEFVISLIAGYCILKLIDKIQSSE